MLDQALYRLTDNDVIRSIVVDHPWVTLVSSTSTGRPVVSHLPVVLGAAAPQIEVLGHLPRADADTHGLGHHDVVLVIQGPHGYISPSWYEATPFVPTWNFVAVHMYGTPRRLDDNRTYDALAATVEHLESSRPSPWQLDSVDAYARGLVVGVTGFSLQPTRVVAKAKLSQDKPPSVVNRVVRHLEGGGQHANPPLAAAMRRLSRRGAPTRRGPSSSSII